MGEELRRTPLWSCHRRGGARLVGFAGWEMPLHYATGQMEEHEIVRTDSGLFDVSHMGRYWISGAGAFEFIDRLITNNLRRLDPDQLLYTPLCLESGGMIDDITVYLFETGCLMVANASNRRSVWDWLVARKPLDVTITDRSDDWAHLALQGPQAQERFAPLVAMNLDAIGYYHHATCRVGGVDDVLISRNGYTGEDGFEIYLPGEKAEGLWNALVDRGVRPIGLGARDTLRMEMGYCLYGNELDTETTPLEAGLGWTVRLKKPDFVGQEALLRQKREGLEKTLIGFEVEGRRMARKGQEILHDGREVGVVTSGGPCPSLGSRGMGLGYVGPQMDGIGTPLTIDVRGTTVHAVAAERPFYKNGTHR